MEVDLKDVLTASNKLAEMAEAYSQAVESFQNLSGPDLAAFEAPSLYEAWLATRDTFWVYAAETQDNLNATSVALLHYINAVCLQDDENAQALFDAVVEHNTETWKDAQEFGETLGPALQAPDLDDPEGRVYEVPEYEPSDRPPGRG